MILILTDGITPTIGCERLSYTLGIGRTITRFWDIVPEGQGGTCSKMQSLDGRPDEHRSIRVSRSWHLRSFLRNFRAVSLDWELNPRPPAPDVGGPEWTSSPQNVMNLTPHEVSGGVMVLVFSPPNIGGIRNFRLVDRSGSAFLVRCLLAPKVSYPKIW